MLLNEKYQRVQGNVIGGWTLVKPLGSGLNGDVWEVSKSGFDNSAMKIMKSPNKILLNRFITEIQVLSGVDIVGVIKVIESNIPYDQNKDLPWFVMPKAIDVYEGFKNKSTLEVAAQFVLLAETLAKLHDLEIIHGDINPKNTLYYKERLNFCDFGAAKYLNRMKIKSEDKDALAIFKMPRAEYAKRVDVYCLARTLWMMLTKQPKRFEGQYNANSEIAIERFCKELNTTALDNLLIESTDKDKRIRPSASQFGLRLKEWIEVNDASTELSP
jgi:serine/threonine-protein kinase